MPKSSWGLLTSSFLPPRTLPLTSRQVRCASLTSAINRGKRRSRAAGSPKRDGPIVRYQWAKGETWDERDTSDPFAEQSEISPLDKPREDDGLSVLDRRELSSDSSRPARFMGLPSNLRREASRDKFSASPSINGSSDKPKNLNRRQEAATTKTHVKLPGAVPYTTPASEFIYGTSAIRSALRCCRRKLYKLYVYDGMMRQSGGESRDESLAKLALINGVQVKNVAGDWIRLLDKMSSGRPHNGYILEASPLPKLPVINYEPVLSPTAGNFSVTLGHQSREGEDINGTNNQIPSLGRFASPLGPTQHRYPFTLLLDGILDPGNLGAIIRSAYYLGVDAITFAARNSAPFSPVTIKSSAGAAENIPLLSVINTVQFVDTSRSNGWRFFAAEAPGSVSSRRDRGQGPRGFGFPTHASLSELGQALTESPCVLMLGGEGMGLSSNLRKRADTFIGIPGARMGDVQGDAAGVDSLNVSVASALLCEAFLRGPTDKAATESIQSLHEGTTADAVETQAPPEASPGEASEVEQEPDPRDEEKLF